MQPEVYRQLIDVPRRLWDPTEGAHSRHGERDLWHIGGLEVHWVGNGAVGDHGDTSTELLGFEAFHEKSKGWYDLFYNVGGDTQGFQYEGRDVTIPSQSNLKLWLTYLVVLGDRDSITIEERAIIRHKIWQWWGAVDPLRANETLRRHGDRDSTACPGGIVTSIVNELHGGWSPRPDPPPTLENDMIIQLAHDPETQKSYAFWNQGGRVHFDEYGSYRGEVGTSFPGLSYIIDAQVRANNWVKAG